VGWSRLVCRSPEGPNESSPVRSAGLTFRKSDPSRMGRSKADEARPLRETGKQTVLSSLPGRTSPFLYHFPALRTGLLSLSRCGAELEPKQTDAAETEAGRHRLGGDDSKRTRRSATDLEKKGA
jgi:hypothetical protein